MNVKRTLRLLAVLSALFIAFATASPMSPAPAGAQVAANVEVDVAGVHGGNTNVDILLNGELVVEDHLVTASRHRGVDTVTATTVGPIETIEVRFDNDSSRNNLYLYGVRVDGVEADLTHGVIIRAGRTAEIPVQNGQEVAMWWNASYHLGWEAASPGPGRPNRWLPSDTTFNWGGGETLAKVETLLDNRDRTVIFDDGEVRDDTPAQHVTINVPAGLPDAVDYIEREFARLNRSLSSDSGGHVVVNLAPGNHRFAKKLSFKRGKITLQGAGADLTTVEHDFDEGVVVDHAIEFRSPALAGDKIGFAQNEILADAVLLDSVTLQDFTVTYAINPMVDIQDDEVEGGLTVEDLREVASQNFVPRYAAANPARNNLGDTDWQRQAAISLDGVLEANVIDLRAYMVGSHFLGVYESRGVFADGLVADGTLNRGGGGNGYALEMIQSHDSVIRFDAVIDYRHISINNDDSADIETNWSTNNVIGAEYTNTNMDFHQSSERANILYAEMTVSSPYISALNYGADGTPGGWGDGWYWSYELSERRDSWGLFEVRNDNAADNNDWFADVQIAAGELNKGGDPVGGRTFELVNPYFSLFREHLRASSNDGLLYGGYNNDELVGGPGKNTFVFAADRGTDTVVDFGPDDRISIQVGTDGIADEAAAANRVTRSGDDVSINLGYKVTVVIEGAASFFDEDVNLEVADHVFYGSEHKDFTYAHAQVG